MIQKVAWKSSLIGKNEVCEDSIPEPGGHASIWWDQVQVRRQQKGKGKYMRQDAIEVTGEMSTLRLDRPKACSKG